MLKFVGKIEEFNDLSGEKHSWYITDEAKASPVPQDGYPKVIAYTLCVLFSARHLRMWSFENWNQKSSYSENVNQSSTALR